MNLKAYSNQNIFSHLKDLVRSERKITAEIVECIREIDRRRMYLELGHTSLFSFLTKEMGYTPSSAQRRIDAARLSRELPQINKDLESGALNLSQISIVAQGLRQKKKDEPKSQVSFEDKSRMLTEVKNQDLPTSERRVAQVLDIKPQKLDRKRHQQDQSVRIEATFSKEQMKAIERAKELISHINPNPNFAELVSYLANAFLQRKDPLLKKTEDSRRTRATVPVAVERQIAEEMDNKIQVTQETNISPKSNAQETSPPKPNRYIPAKRRAEIFQRDLCCQWRDRNGHLCASRFQLQIDHKLSVCEGGGHQPENLQVLCSTHNALKYRYETGGQIEP